MDIVAVIVLVFLLALIFSTNSASGWGWTRFEGANILWTILVILLILWLLRRVF